MKLPAIAFLNSLGFSNVNQKVAYAFQVLKACTSASPRIIVTPRSGNQQEVSVPAIRSSNFYTAISNLNFDQPNLQVTGTINLPYLESHKSINAPFSLAFISEVVTGVILDDWMGNKASNTPETSTALQEPLTLEQYLYKYADLSPDCTISTTSVDVPDGKGNTITLPCKQIGLELPLASDYAFGDEQLQLDKILISLI